MRDKGMAFLPDLKDRFSCQKVMNDFTYWAVLDLAYEHGPDPTMSPRDVSRCVACGELWIPKPGRGVFAEAKGCTQYQKLREALGDVWTDDHGGCWLQPKEPARFWWYGPGSFCWDIPRDVTRESWRGFISWIRHNCAPWIGSDGNNTWCRQTIVIPFFGLGALTIGLRWHYVWDCPDYADVDENEEIRVL